MSYIFISFVCEFENVTSLKISNQNVLFLKVSFLLKNRGQLSSTLAFFWIARAFSESGRTGDNSGGFFETC